MTSSRPEQLEIALLGGGCFWCLEGVFEQLTGVGRVISGYAGGLTVRPTYEEVCTGSTGHAEVVQLHYNPDLVRFEDLLEVFFAIHDPTSLNRQGGDIGTQYRSVIFPQSPEQERIAREKIAELNASNQWPGAIVTTIEPYTEFYPAEDYHQEYFRHNPRQPYCQAVVGPKVRKFREKFAERLKPEFSDA